jgi:hypothetical protein
MISGFALNFAGRLDGGRRCVMLCCEPIGNVPAIALGETGEETILAFMRMREGALLECASPGEERAFTAGCAKCANYQAREWKDSHLIGSINLSCYPSPCQCGCVYCEVDKSPAEGAAEAYETMFGALDYAIGEGLLAPGAPWQVSCGEIAIHPHKDRILDLVEGRQATFYTNCFRFDYQIAANLAANPNSCINLSVDAGTRGTWHRIKGFDNFGKVIGNLAKYRESCSRGGQITLKYIVLPGVNDGPDDYAGAVAIMKALGTPHLTLARDYRTKYGQGEEDREALLAAAARLVFALSKNGLSCDLFTFAPSERERVRDLAMGALRGQAPPPTAGP